MYTGYISQLRKFLLTFLCHIDFYCCSILHIYFLSIDFIFFITHTHIHIYTQVCNNFITHTSFIHFIIYIYMQHNVFTNSIICNKLIRISDSTIYYYQSPHRITNINNFINISISILLLVLQKECGFICQKTTFIVYTVSL